MKIERINDRQIKCTLTLADLTSRQLKLSELAYGTDKAKSLFRDMMEQAHNEVGFDAEDIPLMIEAIPMNTDSIVLIITKVEDPEDIDNKFPKLSPAAQEESTEEFSTAFDKLDGADPESPLNLVKIFSFPSLDAVIRAAHMLSQIYDGPNSLYKDTDTHDYYLAVSRSDTDKTAFFKVCNMLSEYGLQNLSTGATLAFLEEHCECIISAKAVQTLIKL